MIELRVAGVSTIEQANAFLPSFVEEFNRRFAVRPEDPQPALNRITCLKEERQATNGSLISYNGQLYRLTGKDGALSLPPRAKVTVVIHLDGSIEALYCSKAYSLEPFAAQPTLSTPT